MNKTGNEHLLLQDIPMANEEIDDESIGKSFATEVAHQSSLAYDAGHAQVGDDEVDDVRFSDDVAEPIDRVRLSISPLLTTNYLK